MPLAFRILGREMDHGVMIALIPNGLDRNTLPFLVYVTKAAILNSLYPDENLE
jgi:hypothetical protein